ncbi:MAG: DegV family protein [Solirubrobacterales bacterium]
MNVPRVAVVTDTTAYLPDALVREHGIGLVSLHVSWDGQSQRESDMDLDAFYERLRGAQEFPTTSQPSIGDFLEVYEPLAEAGRDIASIHLSGGISGTVGVARQAAERIAKRPGTGRVTVIDSASMCGGLALVVLAAARAAAGGGDAEEVASRAADARQEMKMWFALDTLEYLRRGGRIGAASAWLGSALKIKPILTLGEQITPVERVRTHDRVLQRLIHYAQQRKADGCEAWLVQHIQAPDEAARLVEAAQEVMGCPPLLASEVGPVGGCYAGPGMLGIGAMPAKYLE